MQSRQDCNLEPLTFIYFLDTSTSQLTLVSSFESKFSDSPTAATTFTSAETKKSTTWSSIPAPTCFQKADRMKQFSISEKDRDLLALQFCGSDHIDHQSLSPHETFAGETYADAAVSDDGRPGLQYLIITWMSDCKEGSQMMTGAPSCYKIFKSISSQCSTWGGWAVAGCLKYTVQVCHRRAIVG